MAYVSLSASNLSVSLSSVRLSASNLAVFLSPVLCLPVLCLPVLCLPVTCLLSACHMSSVCMSLVLCLPILCLSICLSILPKGERKPPPFVRHYLALRMWVKEAFRECRRAPSHVRSLLEVGKGVPSHVRSLLEVGRRPLQQLRWPRVQCRRAFLNLFRAVQVSGVPNFLKL